MFFTGSDNYNFSGKEIEVQSLEGVFSNDGMLRLSSVHGVRDNNSMEKFSASEMSYALESLEQTCYEAGDIEECVNACKEFYNKYKSSNDKDGMDSFLFFCKELAKKHKIDPDNLIKSIVAFHSNSIIKEAKKEKDKKNKERSDCGCDEREKDRNKGKKVVEDYWKELYPKDYSKKMVEGKNMKKAQFERNLLDDDVLDDDDLFLDDDEDMLAGESDMLGISDSDIPVLDEDEEKRAILEKLKNEFSLEELEDFYNSVKDSYSPKDSLDFDDNFEDSSSEPFNLSKPNIDSYGKDAPFLSFNLKNIRK